MPVLAGAGVLAALWAMAVVVSPGRDYSVPVPQATTADGTTPAPWEYDPETNRHWDPAHGHWHNGPPPPGVEAPPDPGGG